jgi:hypothetical protein
MHIVRGWYMNMRICNMLSLIFSRWLDKGCEIDMIRDGYDDFTIIKA